MRKLWLLVVVVASVLALSSCTQTGISAAEAKEAYGSKPSEDEMERELKKAGDDKWEEYQRIKQRDAAVEAQQRAVAGAEQTQTH
ncbi:MAG: hypothetical protein KF784_06505 [Fimbriimonadaceae bacterium]|nr:hypothetical protein [Fimbriimonadaceae bacterium]